MITIHDYDPTWPAQFERSRAALADCLGPLALRIDHIGSTSVPGLGAKDVIDVQVTVKELTPEIVPKLAAAGFVHIDRITGDHVPLGEDENPTLWRKLIFSQPDGERRANIHVRVDGNPNQRYPCFSGTICAPTPTQPAPSN